TRPFSQRPEPRNDRRGNSESRTDLRVSKIIHFGGRNIGTVFWEMFNVFNTDNWLRYQGRLRSSQFELALTEGPKPPQQVGVPVDCEGNRVFGPAEGGGMVKQAATAAVLLAIAGLGLEAQGGRGGAQPAGPQKAIAIRAGRVIDPETGTAGTNQTILVEGELIRDIGPNVAIPPGADVIDLTRLSVLPGLVDTHTHEALTYKEIPENNIYYYTYVTDPTPLRAIQAASNAMQLLASGFTVVCDVGNNALYADTSLRQAIEQGWIP